MYYLLGSSLSEMPCASAHSCFLNFFFVSVICLAGFGNLPGDMVCFRDGKCIYSVCLFHDTS